MTFEFIKSTQFSINQYLLEMASLIDLERLQNEKQMSHPVQQLKPYLSPSLTP